MVKNPPANAGDARETGSIPESGRSPRARNGNLLQYSSLENSMDRGVHDRVGHDRATKHTHTRIVNVEIVGNKLSRADVAATQKKPYA